MVELRAGQGERIDLYLGQGPYYRTMIDEVPDDRTFITPLPTYKGGCGLSTSSCALIGINGGFVCRSVTAFSLVSTIMAREIACA